MTVLLNQIFSFLKLLNSETGTNQIAAGFACGFILGFTPVFSLQSLLVFVCLFLFRIQIIAALVAAFFFAFPAFLLDPMFDAAGSWFLQLRFMRPIFQTLYNAPIIPFTRFYNSIVMGSALITIVLAPLVYWGSMILVTKYRKQVVERFKKTKFWKFVQATAFYKWYAKYDEYFGQ